ncbi:MAG: hypothetical protein SWK76_01445 [Actinomycetota bacterium]|nr:hypothetical protein [Actinomycetota bacterium]
MGSIRYQRGIIYRYLLILVSLLVLLLMTFLSFLSCGGSTTQEQEKVQPGSKEQNADTLGRIMGHRNQIEGEVNEPVDASITGEVAMIADGGEDTWMMLKVQDFHCVDASGSGLSMTPGSEVSVKLRKDEGDGQLAPGEMVQINARISKSMEGPVIIGRTCNKL